MARCITEHRDVGNHIFYSSCSWAHGDWICLLYLSPTSPLRRYWRRPRETETSRQDCVLLPILVVTIDHSTEKALAVRMTKRSSPKKLLTNLSYKPHAVPMSIFLYSSWAIKTESVYLSQSNLMQSQCRNWNRESMQPSPRLFVRTTRS